MRPAQLTPENKHMGKRRSKCLSCFNEAGAINAGKRVCIPEIGASGTCFNEAGAINAGKLAHHQEFHLTMPQASMRPAQLTPEN